MIELSASRYAQFIPMYVVGLEIKSSLTAKNVYVTKLRNQQKFISYWKVNRTIYIFDKVDSSLGG